MLRQSRKNHTASTTNGEHTITAAFAWLKGGTGRMVLEHERGLVTRLTVIFDQ